MIKIIIILEFKERNIVIKGDVRFLIYVIILRFFFKSKSKREIDIF